MRRPSMIVVPVALALAAMACSSNGGSESASGGDSPSEDDGNGEVVEFKEASLIVETNATDGDAGLQVFLDHEPWRSIAISLPDGTRIVDVQTEDVLVEYGLTELFSESSEPPFDEFPFEEFVELFPEGDYTFEGETIDGVMMRSIVTLSHDIPDGPVILFPEEDSTVATDALVVRWEPVAASAGIEIVGYRVGVERDEEPILVLDVQLSAEATELSVPAEFMDPGVEYKVEVLAIADNGNQTITEVPFLTE